MIKRLLAVIAVFALGASTTLLSQRLDGGVRLDGATQNSAPFTFTGLLTASGGITVGTSATFTTPILAPNGSTGAPAYSFALNPNQGLYSEGATAMALIVGGVSMLDLNSSNGVTANFLTASTLGLGGKIAFSNTAPTISAFGGTGAAVVGGSTTAAWRIGVGTVAPGTTGNINLPTATTGWNCWVWDQTNPLDITRQTASTTAQVTITSTIAWSASDILIGGCAAF
jgi:hypothetical protein